MTVGLGVVGAGYWGKNLVRNFARVKRGTLRVVCDLDPRHREMAASVAPDAEISSDFSRLVARADVDAVAVCTPATTHYALARQALLADKHVYVEKPLTLDVAEAEELVALARARGRILMVGHLMLFHPALQWIKQRLDGGEFGEIYYLYCQRLNLGIVRADESAWWSLAPHDLSMAQYLLGAAPVSVSARGNSYLRRGIEDVVFANLQFATGQAAQVHTSWLDPHKIRRLTIVGSKKMVTFDDTEPREKVRVYDQGADRGVNYETWAEVITMRQGDILIPAITGTEPLAVECQHFVDCVADGREPLTPGEQGRDVVRVLCAGQASMDAGGAPVAFDPR